MGKLWDVITQPVVRRLMGAFTRKALVALGVWLAARDVDTTGWEQFVEVAAPIIASVVWTLVDKVRTEDQIERALDLPAGTSREALARPR